MITSVLHLDKVTSSTRHAGITRNVTIGYEITARPGYVLAVKVLSDKVTYDHVEIVTGRFVKVRRDDILAVTLGSRSASQGFAGVVPETVRAGDTLQILNMGGVCGACTAFHPKLGKPFDVEVLGTVLTYPSMEARVGVPAHILSGPIEAAIRLSGHAPVIYISGTSMNSGKTTAACEIIRELVRFGLAVAACKLTGVSLMRDTLTMTDAGAVAAFDFTDAGAPVTDATDAPTISMGIIDKLIRENPDVIVAELGDGLLGQYGVAEILEEKQLMSLAAAHVLCAADPVGAYGAARLFKERFSQSISVISGPVTDNEVGRKQIREILDLPAVNAFQDPGELSEFLMGKVKSWKKP